MSSVNVVAVIEAIAAVVQEAVKLGPVIIKTAQDAEPFAKAIYGLFTGTNVTQQQLDDLAARIAALSAQLQEPLPPDDLVDPA